MSVIKRKAIDGKTIWCVRRMIGGKSEFKSFGTGAEARDKAERYDAQLLLDSKSRLLGESIDHSFTEAIEAAEPTILSAVRTNSQPTYKARLKP